MSMHDTQGQQNDLSHRGCRHHICNVFMHRVPAQMLKKFLTAGCLKNLSPTGFLWALLLDNIILLAVAGDGWDLQCGDE